MADEKKKSGVKSRLEFLEDGSGKPLKIEEPEPLDEEINYPLLARYDFVGTGPRVGIRRDEYLYDHACKLKTFGERIKPTVVRIGWIFLRVAVGLIILYFVLRGHTFSCAGTEVSFQ
jgi:hypothetical protein